MSYNPEQGRWLEADPIGGPDIASPGKSAIIENAEQRARDRITEKLGYKYAEDHALWDLGDGANTYQFLGDNPASGTDPSGMDRYIIDGGYGHHGIAVDTWAIINGKWVKTGTQQYDFSADYRWGPLALGALTCGCPGRVRTAPGISGTPVGKPIPSTPQQDMALKGNLDAAMANPPVYHIGFNNCNDFAQEHILDGLPGHDNYLP